MIAAFIRSVRAGLILMGRGGSTASALADGVAVLTLDDLDAVTAEAYNQHALGAELPWEEGRALVENEIRDDRARLSAPEGGDAT